MKLYQIRQYGSRRVPAGLEHPAARSTQASVKVRDMKRKVVKLFATTMLATSSTFAAVAVGGTQPAAAMDVNVAHLTSTVQTAGGNSALCPATLTQLVQAVINQLSSDAQRSQAAAEDAKVCSQ